MKRKLSALLLAAAMIVSMIPAAGAASSGGFEASVSMPLLSERTSGLYDKPEQPLPDAAQSGFIRNVEGWSPTEISTGLPVAVGAADASAVEISTAQQLQTMTVGSYVLTADIDLTGVAWTPLYIRGDLTLDGQGHTIRGLDLISNTNSTSGLIGQTEGNLTVRNLCWEDISLTVDYGATSGDGFARGTLVGMVSGTATLQNIAARNVVITRANAAGKNLGGIVGHAQMLAMEDCFFDVTVQRDAAWLGTNERGCGAIGGVLGDGTCTAVRCYLKADLDSADAAGADVGGLVGNGNLSAKDCMLTGKLNCFDGLAGGLMGFTSGSVYRLVYPTIENCVVQAEIRAKNAAGGMIGQCRYADITITDSRYAGTITMEEGGTASAGGLIGFLRGSLKAVGCASDLTLATVHQNQSSPELRGRAGGLIGHVESADYELVSCSAAVSGKGINSRNLYVGGLAGDYQYGSVGVIRDSFADVDIPDFALVSGSLTVGGLVAQANTVVVTNCGANLNLSVENTVRTGSGVFGGLIGYAYTAAQIARSYASGTIQAVWAGEVNEPLAAGGLIGSCYTHAKLSLGQCYGGVNIGAQFRDGVRSCALGGLIGKGEDCMIYSSWSDSTVSADVPEGSTRENGKGHLGGLMGYGRGTVMDSCFTGTIPSVVMGYAGGLVGQGITTMYNCYAQTDLPGGGMTGGLVGASGTVMISDCRFDGRIKDTWNTTGGILGEGGGTILRCNTGGEISAPGQIAGGIAGSFGGTVEGCRCDGSVGGSVVGGIAGSADTVNDCTVTGRVDIASTEDTVSCELGGIAGYARWVDNCHVKRKLYVNLDLPKTSGHYENIGGIAGRTGHQFGRGAVTNSSIQGISVSMSEGSANINVGGIVGQGGARMDFRNCRVSGGVRCTNTIGYIYVGGIAGSTYDSNIKSCSVSGGVSGYVSDPKDGNGPIFTGGAVGWGSNGVILDGVSCGSGSGSAANPDVQIRKDNPEIGVGAINKEYIPNTDSSHKKEESHVIRTYWYPEMSLSMLPLGGAQISIDGAAVGTTGADGALVLDGDFMPGGIVRISAEAEGYFGTERVTYLTKSGTTNLYLEKKTPGKIYLRSALIYDEEEHGVELLYSNNSVNILLNEEGPRHFFFGVDWNDTQEEGRKLQLVDQSGNVRVNLTANVDSFFQVQRFFEPDEEIYLKASGFQGDGTETVNQVRLPLKVRMFTPTVPVVTEEIPMGDNNGKRGIDALAGVKIGLDFNNLSSVVRKLTYDNHVLTLEFGGNPVESPKFKLLGTQGKVGVKGIVSATDADKDTPVNELQWSGGVHVFAQLDPALAYAPVSIPGKPPFPFTFYSEVKAGADFGVDIYGTIKKPRIGGALTLDFDANTTAGLGASANRDWLLMIGGRLGGAGKYTSSLSVGKEDLISDAYGELTAYMDVAVIGKGGELVNLDAGYQFGKIVWNSKDGTSVYALGTEVAEFPREERRGAALQWVPADQSYLAAGGGFCTDPMRQADALNSWNGNSTPDGDQSNVTHLYENIAQGSTAALAVENGTPVLYFTADDGNRELEGSVSGHTALWRAVRTADGSWSEPVIVSGSENGYPDQVQADGSVAVWEESTQTGSLEELLRSTRIKVSVNGEVFHTIETGGYSYNVRVSAAEDGSGILVSWLSAPEVHDFASALSAEPALCYAHYSDGAWSQGTVDTLGAVPLDAVPDYERLCIVWTDTEGSSHRNSGAAFSSSEERLTALAACAVNGPYTAEMELDGRLIIWNETAEERTLQTGAGGGTAPLLLEDGNGVYYVLWVQADGIYCADSASGWNKIRQICASDQQVMGLSGVVADGSPVVTYYKANYNEDQKDHVYQLYMAQMPDLSGVDLAITQVEVDDTDVAQTGVVTVTAAVENQRDDIVSAYTYTVADDAGRSLYTETVSDAALGFGDTAICSVLIPADVTMQRRYTVRVTAQGDLDSTNDSAQVGTTSDAALQSVGFTATPEGKTGLEVIVGNDGSAPAEKLTVEISRCAADGTVMGDALVSETFDAVYAGSYRQVVLDEAVMDTLYKVVLLSDGEELASRMLMWSDPEVSGAWITGVDVDEQGTARVNLSAQNWTQDLVLHLAVYRNGKMVANAAKALDAWTGAKTLEFDFADALKDGTYTYSAFLLKQHGLIPVAEQLSGSITIGG